MLYKDNSNLKLKTITLFNGEIEYRHNCKYINQQYYRKNEHCVEIGSKWYLFTDPKIKLDHSIKQYVLTKNKRFYYGIVDIIDDQIIFGEFSQKNSYYTTIVYFKNEITCCLNSKILLESNLFLECSFGYLYYIPDLSEKSIQYLLTVRNNENFNHLRQGYNIEDNDIEFDNRIYLHSNFYIECDKGVKKYAKFLKSYTFGCEFESSKGYISTEKLNQLGLVPCRDGSVSGAEYVTIPLQGAKGLQTIKNVCNQLKKSVEIDINCSYHVHIGNLRRDRPYLIALYMLFYKIQDELFEMFPYYKTNPEGIKQKNYCQKLKKLNLHPLKEKTKEGWKSYIKFAYNKIFYLLSEKNLPSYKINSKKGKHPVQNKWDRKTSRYFALNLSNMLFSDRRTAEFRISPPTTNYIKATNLLFIYTAIVKYADINCMKILTCSDTISLKEVINIYKTTNIKSKYAEFLSDYLNAYINHQKETFKNDLVKGDVISNHDIINDKNFEFYFGNVNCLF